MREDKQFTMLCLFVASALVIMSQTTLARVPVCALNAGVVCYYSNFFKKVVTFIDYDCV